MKVAHDLRHGFLDAEELISEKIVEFYRFVFVESFDVRIAIFVNVAHARFHNRVVQAGMGKLCDRRIGLYLFKIAQQIAAPRTRLVQVAIFLDEGFEFLIIVHSSSLPFPYCYGPLWVRTCSRRGALRTMEIAVRSGCVL